MLGECVCVRVWRVCAVFQYHVGANRLYAHGLVEIEAITAEAIAKAVKDLSHRMVL
jgi:hypothetical protein